jgi:PDZ domain-containing protein
MKTTCLSLMVALLFVASVPLAVRAQPAAGNPSARHGWMGLAGEDSDAGAQGVVVVDILPGSPAASAGLRVGDRIGAVNGRPVSTYLDLARRMAVFAPGTAVRLSVRRGNRVRDVTVTLGEPPATLPPAPTRSTNGPRGRPSAPAPAPAPARSSGSSGSAKWSCRAVGSYAPGGSNGPDYSDPQNIDFTEYGDTRDAAGLAALDDCSGMLNLKTNIVLNPGALVLDYCKVIRCSHP